MRWWAGQDSNLQPDRYERPALTIELPARMEPPGTGRVKAYPLRCVDGRRDAKTMPLRCLTRLGGALKEVANGSPAALRSTIEGCRSGAAAP